MSYILLLVGSAIAVVWGIAHIVPVKNIIKSFGEISKENKLILTMEWLAEGAALIFLGALVLVLTLLGFQTTDAGSLVIKLCASMLVVMAALTAFTGARTSIIPIKICPVIKLAASAMWFIAVFAG